MIEFATYLFLSYVLMAIAEYWIHRVTMHKRLFPKGWFDWIFEEHAIEHHKKERYDINVDLPVYFHLILGMPLLIITGMYLPVACLALLIIFFYHSYVWTHAHRAIHELENNWLMNYEFFWNMKDHHIKHHERPNTNFGVVFLWTDSLFRTKYDFIHDKK